MTTIHSERTPRMAQFFGAAGLIPFISLAAVPVTPWTTQGLFMDVLLHHALLAYGAVILSFIGGCRWGFSCAGHGPGPSFAAILIAIIPSLYAVIAPVSLAIAFVRPSDAITWGCASLALGHFLMLLEDWRATRAGWVPSWWLKLRIPLAFGAMTSLLAPIWRWV